MRWLLNLYRKIEFDKVVCFKYCVIYKSISFKVKTLFEQRQIEQIITDF